MVSEATIDIQDLVLSTRYGDLDELKQLLQKHFAAATDQVDSLPSNQLAPLFLAKDPNGQTATHMAAANGHLNCLEFILLHLAPTQVNVTNEEGSTPLHWASLNGHLECVKLLLKHGANATLKNTSGRSSVTLAEQQSHLQVVQELLASFDPEEDEEEEGEEEQVDENVDTVYSLDQKGKLVSKQIASNNV